MDGGCRGTLPRPAPRRVNALLGGVPFAIVGGAFQAATCPQPLSAAPQFAVPVWGESGWCDRREEPPFGRMLCGIAAGRGHSSELPSSSSLHASQTPAPFSVGVGATAFSARPSSAVESGAARGLPSPAERAFREVEGGSGPLTPFAAAAAREAAAASAAAFPDAFAAATAAVEGRIGGPRTRVGKRRRESLEESARRVVSRLQVTGTATFRDLYASLAIDYRRVYDILNVLEETPLLEKAGRKKNSCEVFNFCGGRRFPEAIADVELPYLLPAIAREQAAVEAQRRRVLLLRSSFGVPFALPVSEVLHTLIKEDPSLLSDPLYAGLVGGSGEVAAD